MPDLPFKLPLQIQVVVTGTPGPGNRGYHQIIDAKGMPVHDLAALVRIVNESAAVREAAGALKRAVYYHRESATGELAEPYAKLAVLIHEDQPTAKSTPHFDALVAGFGGQLTADVCGLPRTPNPKDSP